MRKIGIELECILPEDRVDRVRRAVRELDCNFKGDGSIETRGEEVGAEVTTKPITLETAKTLIPKLTEVLLKNGARVNRTCGLHIHAGTPEIDAYGVIGNRVRTNETAILYNPKTSVLDALSRDFGNPAGVVVKVVGEIPEEYDEDDTPFIRAHTIERLRANGTEFRLLGNSMRSNTPRGGNREISLEEASKLEVARYDPRGTSVAVMKEKLYNALNFFAVADQVLRSFIPSERRRNTYCKPFQKVSRSGGRMPQNWSTIMDGITERYCGINFNALSAHGTIENRYHSGTLNAQKILAWARLWSACVDIALSGEETIADELGEVVSLQTKTDILFSVLGLGEATEKYLKERQNAFAGSDNRRAKVFISKNKKICVE